MLNDAVRSRGCQALQDQLTEQQSSAHAIRADLYDPAMLIPSEEAAIVRAMGTLQSQMGQVQAEVNDCLNPGASSVHPQGCQALQDKLVGLRYGAQVIKTDLSDCMLDPSEVAALSGTLGAFTGSQAFLQLARLDKVGSCNKEETERRLEQCKWLYREGIRVIYLIGLYRSKPGDMQVRRIE
jgi:hypothetical protein